MAPITRTGTRPSGSGGISKNPQRKRSGRKEPSDGWELTVGDGQRPTTNGTTKTFSVQDETAMPTPPPDFDDAVAPLREVAERVGKEAEYFAETLDEFFNELPTVDNRFDAATDLVLKFRDIANNMVEQLKSRYDRELRQQLRQEWSEQARVSASSSASKPLARSTAAAVSARKAEQVRELRLWQQEADIWDLFRTMLELHPFEEDARIRQQEKDEQLAKLGPPHPYMSEGDLWERFLLEDKVAYERHLIKEWLEKTADHQHSDLQGIMEELETKAGRGKGLWSSGWMHTRESIKGEKRIRAWPSPEESPLPQIRRSDNNELLVTTLDPDAPTRQKRHLEKSDAYFERAMWIACWEMLRRGVPWQEVCEWCEHRKEGWRGVCLGGAVDRTEVMATTAPFRRVCQMASEAGLSSDHEIAVFGLLGGDVKAVEKVCKTVDDHLYAYYSAALLKQFDDYLLRACPHKAAPKKWQRNLPNEPKQDPAQAEEAILQLISRLRQAPTTSNESTQPMKIIEGYTLADEVGSLVREVGAAIAETAAVGGPEDVVFLRDRDAGNTSRTVPEREVGLAPQTLRIVTHMAMVHRALRSDDPEELEADELMEDENVLVAYIQALRAVGKRDLIPIYASKLQRGRYVNVLGRMLQDIKDDAEQTRMLNLLSEYEFDTTAILTEQLRWTFVHSLPKTGVVPPLRILERTTDTELHPGQQIILDFIPEEITAQDQAILTCLQWFWHMHGGWELTFEALSMALRRCLVNGRLACARMIVDNFAYEDISLRKSYEEIGRAMNVMTTNARPHDEHERMRWNLMKRQSNTYYELSQLVEAMLSLAEWRTEEHKYVDKVPRPTTAPSALKVALANVTTTMEPILRGILQQPVDDNEETDLAFIRVHYLPEIVIAYNTVLHAAGNLITRDTLLDSMNLSVTIADGARDGEDNGLQECFVKAGRMRELVESFALTSKVMLLLKQRGKVWKAGNTRKGQDLGMWEIGVAREEDDKGGD